MTLRRLLALAYLAWRALVVQPLKRLLLRLRGRSGVERFLASYAGEGLGPTRPEDRAVGEEAAACISCGLCEFGCDLSSSVPGIRALGLHAAFRLYSRSAAELRFAADALGACASCTGCDALCPTGVPISRIVRYLHARVTDRNHPTDSRSSTTESHFAAPQRVADPAAPKST